MKNILTLAAFCAAAGGACAAPGLASAAEVRFKDVVASVQIIPENRADFQVDVRRTHPGLPPFKITHTANGGVLVDGGLFRRIRGCGTFGGISIFGLPRMAKNDVPQIVVHAPLDFSLRANGNVRGQIGNSRTLTAEVSGCGDWNIADVGGKLDLDVSGLGDVHVGRTGSARVALSGMGDVNVASVNGPLNIETSGMGGIRVHGGHATVMRASLSGMGDLTFNGVADSLDASASGMGDIKVTKVTGPVHKSRSGLASIDVGR